MKNILLTVLLCVLPLSASQAETRWFFGGGGGLMTLDDSADKIDPTNVFFRGGLSLSEHIDIGIERSISLIEDSLGSVDFGVNTTFIFARANLSVSEDTTLYLMMGASDVELSASANGTSIFFDDRGTGFGFGAQFDLGDSSAFTIDYINYYDDSGISDGVSDVTVYGINLGYVAYF